jgi:cytochrome c peroxidase
MKKPLRIGMFALWLVGIALFAVWVSGCAKTKHTAARVDPHSGTPFSQAKLDSILHATEAVSAQASQADLVNEGRRLFRSTTVAKQGESCNTCHQDGGTSPELGIIIHPTAAGDFTGPRNAQALWNVGKTAPYGWTGATPTLNAFATRVVGNFFKAGKTQPADVTARQVAALVAYMNQLDPPVSNFDLGRLSPLAKEGEALFMGKGHCAECHTPPLFTDKLTHNIGVRDVPGAADPGAADPAGGFQTPQLRDIASIAPYMHNAIFPTLDDVLSFYNSGDFAGPQKIQLSGPERDAIVQFLKEL